MSGFPEYDRYDALGLAELVRQGEVSRHCPIEAVRQAREPKALSVFADNSFCAVQRSVVVKSRGPGNRLVSKASLTVESKKIANLTMRMDRCVTGGKPIIGNRMGTKGIITSWNDDRGFGFIKPNAGNKKVFAHIKSFSNRNRRPEINALVIYSESTDNLGRPRAVNVEFAGDKNSKSKRKKSGSTSGFIAIFFLVIVGVSVYINQISSIILVFYVILSFVTFLWYAKDKAAAQGGRWRTPESTLHLMSLVGGWPGAIIAQQKLRHKSQKQPFRSIFWITVLLNCGVFIWLFTPEGSAIINSLIVKMGKMANQALHMGLVNAARFLNQ